MKRTKELERELRSRGESARAKVSRRFFKTGPGEYGEGDIFWGVSVPECRKVAKLYKDLSLTEVKQVLCSPVHELRLTALVILLEQYASNPRTVYRTYIANRRWVNNWDLVDMTAPKIVGAYLWDQQDFSILYKFSKSRELWTRRIAIVATFAFIRQGDFEHTTAIAKILLEDPHDLIHKAVGWMLREVGKRNLAVLYQFLDRYGDKMPRTALRYAIERLPQAKRKAYLLSTKTS